MLPETPVMIAIALFVFGLGGGFSLLLLRGRFGKMLREEVKKEQEHEE